MKCLKRTCKLNNKMEGTEITVEFDDEPVNLLFLIAFKLFQNALKKKMKILMKNKNLSK